jgi:HEAT repeat protein
VAGRGTLPEHPPPSEEEVRGRVVHAVDLCLSDDGGLLELMELGPAAVPWAAGALLGEPYAGRKTLAQYVQDLGSEDRDTRAAAYRVLEQAGEEAVPLLRAAAGDSRFDEGDGGWVALEEPPHLRNAPARSARLLHRMEKGGATRDRDTEAVERRGRLVRYLALHAPSTELAREALKGYVLQADTAKDDYLSVIWETRHVRAALRALYLAGPRPDDRGFWAKLRAEGDPKRFSSLAELVYSSAALESLDERIDWDVVLAEFERMLGAHTVAATSTDWRYAAGLEALAVAKPELAREYLLREVRELRRTNVRDETYNALAILSDPDLIRPLAEIAAGDDPVEAERAVEVLGLLPGREGVEAAVGALDAPTSSARKAACLALAFRHEARNDKELLPRIQALLEDPDVTTGAAALLALAVLTDGHPPAAQPASGRKLPARLWSLWRSGSRAPDGLYEEVKRVTARRRAIRRKRSPSEYAIKSILRAVAARVGAEERHLPSSITTSSVFIWWLVHGPDEYLVKWAGETCEPGGLWFLKLAEMALAMGVTKVIPKVILSLDSEHPYERARAAALLREIAGGGYGFRADASFAERTAAVTKWWSWWTREGAEAARTRWPAGPTEDEF